MTDAARVREDEIDATVEAILQLSRAMAKHSPKTAEERTRTMLQHQALSHLQAGEVAAGELAEVLRLSQSSATQLVERLVQAGLVQRRLDPADRRQVRLSLTPAGKRELTAMTERLHERWGIVFAGISADELATLRRLLARMTTNVNQDTGGKA